MCVCVCVCVCACTQMYACLDVKYVGVGEWKDLWRVRGRENVTV